MTNPFARVTRWAVVLATAGSLTACLSIGRPFPTQDVSTLGIGKATEAEIQRLYGPPFRTGVQDGDVTWTYVNYKLRVFGDQCTQDLVLRFNADGTLKSFTYNTTAPGSCG